MHPHSSPTFTATPNGILIDGLQLNKSASQSLSPQAMRYVKRAEELLAKVKKEDWNNRTPHATDDIPIIVQAQIMLALASPQPFLPSLNKAGFNPNEPRDERGRWTNDGTAVTVHSNKNITIHHADGSEETRINGSRSWRNNNPGNIVSGTFADAHGAIGNNNGFAVFPDEETGQAAIAALLRTSLYSNLTIDRAIEIYSPATENNVSNDQKNIRAIGGFAGNEVVGQLNSDKFDALVNAIRQNEGWQQGAIIRKP